MTGNRTAVDEFITAACIPMDGSAHASGTLDSAHAILAKNPEIATQSVYTAAVLGNDWVVMQFLQVNPASATSKGGPYGWDALTHLCFSRYLRLEKSRSAGFIGAATALLDSGANPNTGFYSAEHEPSPVFESAIYGAAGVARHAGLTKLLLDRGADPNDGETEYHAPEWFDNEPMQVIVRSGRLKAIGLTTMLLRKLDWTDYDGVVWLLEHGADANAIGYWGRGPLDHALGRDSDMRFFDVLLDYGADPRLPAKDGVNAMARAARMGRGDVLDLFESVGYAINVAEGDAFLAACARGDQETVDTLVAGNPDMLREVMESNPAVVAHFAGAGNTEGLRLLLANGFDIEAKTGLPQTKGYTPLHLAVWRGRARAVDVLLSHGASTAAKTPRGETPLDLARRAMIEVSEWTPHTSSAIVDKLAAVTRHKPRTSSGR